jgi:4'-phosphopantetheinyl transferase EntD
MDLAATGLWPDGVVFREAATSGPAPVLWPEEAAYVVRAAPRRAAEFAWGRDCARAALGALGVGPCAIPAAEDRSPVWPAGVHGTISHTEGYAAAAVARDRQFAGIGLDAEPATRVERRLWPKIATAVEQHWLQGLGSGLEARAATLLFCAKEAFYKCQYPATRRWLGFADVEVELAEVGTHGAFAVRVLGARARGDRTDRAVGRYLVRDDGLLLASAWIAGSDAAGQGVA